MDQPTQATAPCALVIFGAAGDLTKRLLVPALYNLRRARLLPEGFAVIGVARNDKTTATFRRELGDNLREFGNAEIVADDWRWIAERMFYVRGEFADPDLYQRLAQLLVEVGKSHNTGGNYLFYLATPPQVFATIVRRPRQRSGPAGNRSREDAIGRQAPARRGPDHRLADRGDGDRHHPVQERAAGTWIRGILARCPARLATVALANKTARVVWALTMRKESYRSHGHATAMAAV